MLQEIGLTTGETKVYLALISLGMTKTGPLAKKAEVSSSKVYKILDRLIQKGLVGHVLKGKIKFFQALEPKRVVDYLEKKEQDIREKKDLMQKILPQLELERKMSGKKSEAVIYDGLKAIKNFYLGILNELKAGETYFVLGATYGEPEKLGIKEFFQNYHTQRAQKKIKVKMLANYDTKGSLVSATATHSEIKFLPQYLITNMTILFYHHKAFIFFLTEEPIGFLMENEEAVKSFQKYFDTFWKIAKN
mgnify:FL=1